MKHWLIGAAALVGIEAVALACSCINTDDPAQLRRIAADAAKNAIAVVEAEALTSFEATRTGEQMRITRIIAGNAPVHFKLERQELPSSASCDVLYNVGDRAVMILYPATGSTAGTALFRPSGLCTVHLLDKPIFLKAVIDAVGSVGRRTRGERG